MAKIKTHQEFIKEMKIKHPNLRILNQYFNSKTRIKYKCEKCGLIWNATASKLSIGRGCPQCAGNKKKTHQQYVRQLKKINPNIEVKSTYLSTSNNMDFECKICGYQWTTKPGSALKGKGCMLCGKKSMALKLTQSHQDFVKQIYDINPNIKICEKYKKYKEKILCKCLKCGYEWNPWISSLKTGHGCPKCNMSLGENIIIDILNKNKIDYQYQYKYGNLKGVGGNALSYDFYLPKYNILIEYQGKQHKQPIEYFGGEKTFLIQKEHDKRKREYAFNHNIQLIEIWYYENIKQKLIKTLNLETVTTAGR